MNAKKLLFVGFGKIAAGCTGPLLQAGYEIVGIGRSKRAVPEGVHYWQGDVTSPELLQRIFAEAFTTVVVVLSPDEYSPAAYQRTYLDTIVALCRLWTDAPHQPRVIFISSTSVYHQQDGEWVNEGSPAEPSSDTARLILASEQHLHKHIEKSVVIRFSGIYGPARDFLLKQVWAGRGGNQDYTNRIHIADCIGALVHIIQLSDEHCHELYLVSDKTPVKSCEIRLWLAAQLGMDAQRLTDSGATSRGGNKRCDSTRLTQSGYRFLFADFREGYREAIELFLAELKRQ